MSPLPSCVRVVYVDPGFHPRGTLDYTYLTEVIASGSKIREERGLNRGFRSVIADWTPYRTDLEKSESSEFDRERLLRSLRSYFEIQGIQVDWENVQEAQDERLINMVAMACPFEPLEKQALLEAQNLTVRAETLISLIEMVVLSTAGDDSTQQ